MKKRTAVVILNWNGVEMLRSFLPSVVKYSDSADIVVADNGSTDDSIRVLTEEFPMVRQIVLDVNYGFAEGYNRALEQIDAEYSVLLNSDVEVSPLWLKCLTDYMDAHPEVAGCQPKIRSYKKKELFEYAGACGGFMDKYGYPFCRGRIMSQVEVDKGQYDEPISVFWATGAALLVRTNLYKEVGGLDACFFAHMEEIDLCWRMRARGYNLVCVPESIVYHVGGATLSKENPRKTYLNFRNNLLMIYKNEAEGKLSTIMRVRCLLDSIAAFKFFVLGDVANAKAVFKARRDFHKMKVSYEAIRSQNIAATTNHHIPELFHISILFEFYFKAKKTFDVIRRVNR
ncbi:MAG: glycosyltransferase family 2 protein [Bacteroidaceae bacterium]